MRLGIPLAMAAGGLVIGTAAAFAYNAKIEADALATAQRQEEATRPAPAPLPLRPPRPAPPREAPTMASVLAAAKIPARSTGEPHAGFAQFVAWAARHMRWSDAAPPGDAETSPSRIMKDAAAEQGTRACYVGRIEGIRRETFVGSTPFVGALELPNGDVVVFAAVGDTGNIVRGSVIDASNKLCGVTLGTLEVNGEEVIQIVGMFSLPANRSR